MSDAIWTKAESELGIPDETLAALLSCSPEEIAKWRTGREPMPDVVERQLSALCDDLPEGPTREALSTAVDQVEAAEGEHVEWARKTWQRMTMMQAKSSTMMKVSDFAEKAFATVKNAVTPS